ncbi:MAG: succinyl-diaminopimelate desuccinylase [Acidimicrobiales bacterium]
MSAGSPTPPDPPDLPDLLARAAQLVGVASASHHEGAIADLVESELRAVPGLVVDRVGNNVVARTGAGLAELDPAGAGRRPRVLLAGHLDTVPAAGNETPVLEGDRLLGLGAADMKGGLAVLLELARCVRQLAVDVTWVFYACEEVDQSFSGLGELHRARPDLLVADAAVLAEPTGAVVEAGCQGTMRIRVTLRGQRAHTARAWMGTNAIHRLGAVLSAVASYEPRRVVLGGCEFVEALQAVRVEGGVANNVVPDVAQLVLNHRFAPDRARESAFEQVRSVLSPALGPQDSVEVEEAALPAPPCLDDFLLASLVTRSGGGARAKLGWTDVSWFAARGIPAANFGPGDPALAHTPGEWVERAELESTYRVLRGVLLEGP